MSYQVISKAFIESLTNWRVMTEQEKETYSDHKFHEENVRATPMITEWEQYTIVKEVHDWKEVSNVTVFVTATGEFLEECSCYIGLPE